MNKRGDSFRGGGGAATCRERKGTGAGVFSPPRFFLVFFREPGPEGQRGRTRTPFSPSFLFSRSGRSGSLNDPSGEDRERSPGRQERCFSSRDGDGRVSSFSRPPFLVPFSSIFFFF